MYCKKCGKQISEDSKYCSFCGANLKESSDLINNKTNNASYSFSSFNKMCENKNINTEIKKKRKSFIHLFCKITSIYFFVYLFVTFFSISTMVVFMSSNKFDAKIRIIIFSIILTFTIINMCLNVFFIIYTKFLNAKLFKITFVSRIVSVIFSIATIVLIGFAFNEIYSKQSIISYIAMGFSIISAMLSSSTIGANTSFYVF